MSRTVIDRGRRSAQRLVAVDVFAGCGGLSAGLDAAGFRVESAIEIDKFAAAVYTRNHPKTKMLVRDVRDVGVADLQRRRPVDLLAGCAPCQGFCALTSKYGREDPRNQLLLEMARLAEELQPSAIVMENVPGLLDRGQPIFAKFLRRLADAGYYSQHAIVQMADYGVPQRRRRLVLVAGRGFTIPIPLATHSMRPERDGRPRWRTVRDALHGRSAPVKLGDAIRRGGPRRHRWHVVRNLQPQTWARLRAAVPGKPWLEVESSLRPQCHRGDYVGFTNVYGRMSWDAPSPTITAGCTTPAKGRFGHPDRRRTTISVREAAILQTFPCSYDFACDYMDAVCEMVGNAVPPLFARILGTAVHKALQSHRAAVARAGR